jgi:DNA polymerase III alpha subunit
MNFIHLNVHSHYSKGWGVGTIEELCQAARDRGIKKLALTDTNGLYGLVFFVQTAREMGIEPIVGKPAGICQPLPDHLCPPLPPGL